jgi:histidine triad (HIT) family protein
MASIFSKIVSGEIPAYKVAEDDRFLAFLDIFPLKKGHTLVIPKKETDYLFDLDPDLYRDLWVFARKVASGLEEAVPCKRIGVAVLGMEVPHAHIHLVPLDHEGDLNFRNPKLSLSREEFAEIARNIAEKI